MTPLSHLHTRLHPPVAANDSRVPLTDADRWRQNAMRQAEHAVRWSRLARELTPGTPQWFTAQARQLEALARRDEALSRAAGDEPTALIHRRRADEFGRQASVGEVVS